MTPGARVAAAIDVTASWICGQEGLDRVLATWARSHRFAGSGDRRAIADIAYGMVRRARSSLWIAGRPDLEATLLPSACPMPETARAAARAMAIGCHRLDGVDPEPLFSGDGYAPASLAEAEHGSSPLSEAPRAVRLDLPDWLMDDARLGRFPDAAIAPQRDRAPLFLRINLPKADPGEAIAALAADCIDACPGPLSETCLRVVRGARGVERSSAYLDGLVEIQDAASQAAADFAAAQPGEAVLDLCAGGGGKTLALAAAMEGRGRLAAHDVAEKRLANLAARAERAGAEVELLRPGQLTTGWDLVFVDAPCSGSGAWSRNPDAKWRLTETRLAELVETQARLCSQALGLVRAGGRVVYATCSLLSEENRAIVDRVATETGATCTASRQWTPANGGDGFFAACLTPS